MTGSSTNPYTQQWGLALFFSVMGFRQGRHGQKDAIHFSEDLHSNGILIITYKMERAEPPSFDTFDSVPFG